MNIFNLLAGIPPPKYLSDKTFRKRLSSILGNAIQAGVFGEITQNLLDSIFEKVYVQFLRLKDIPAGAVRAAILHMRVDDAIKAHWKKFPELKSQLACKANCSKCCYTNISITSDEGELLAQEVKRGLKIDMDQLKRHAAIADSDFETFAKLSWEERACVFLGKDGECRVYEQRPATCRKWFVPSPEGPANCHDLKFKGRIMSVFNAEILSSAAFNLDEKSGRLALKVLEALND